jgi:hypothetical protein
LFENNGFTRKSRYFLTELGFEEQIEAKGPVAPIILAETPIRQLRKIDGVGDVPSRKLHKGRCSADVCWRKMAQPHLWSGFP